ncbi:MAG: aminoglycoside 3'-phosphotransferase [Oscillospiraceae bacterium]|nr:aminoglycoside 3'-phosphotransferase [Oscillospiraceae bacterium]
MPTLNGIHVTNNIFKIVQGLPYTFDRVGMSGSTILTFDDMVLKIEKQSKQFDGTVSVMRWLEDKLPVPKVLCVDKENELCYLLMSRINGKMLCDEYFLERPEELCELLSEGLKTLWSVDISDCPRIRDLDTELFEAKYQVENKLYDLDNVEKDTFGENGRFKTPEDLLQWLFDNKPEYKPVLSHGDFCLPNIFSANGKISGYIDLGDMGVGDKWRDIALCYRSLKHNMDGTFGGKVYEGFNPDLLFEKLGIEKNEKKLDYYIMLDELF